MDPKLQYMWLSSKLHRRAGDFCCVGCVCVRVRVVCKREKMFNIQLTNISIPSSSRDINKRDWVGPLAPLVALYKKNPATGKFDFIDQTERVK